MSHTSTIRDDQQVTILTVDDSPSDRDIFRRLLARSGQRYRFIEAESVAEALDKIGHDVPDCILLDYDLPDAEGTELLREINRIYGENHIPVVMLSGSRSVEIAVETLNAGAQDFLVKSTATSADLVRAVTNAIEKVSLVKEKEAAAERVQISEERYRLLFENTPLPAVVFDRQNLCILAVNDYAILHYGYTHEEFLNLSLYDLDAFENASKEIVLNEFCKNDGSIHRIPAQHRKKDGSIIDVEVNCHDIIFKGRDARFVIVQDITKLKQVDTRLRLSEEFNRAVIESSPDCVKLLDKEGRLEFMNENGLCLMEIDDFNEFRDREWHELWTDECREIVKQTVKMSQRGQVGRFQGFCPTAKGTGKWWDVIVTPVRDEKGNIEKILSVSRDITEIKKIEQEREKILVREKEMREMAESANRAKDEFLALLSHELRTPLNSMYGWARILNRGDIEEHKVRQALEVIERNIRLQNNLIDDLLDVSRIISGKINLENTTVNLCEMLTSSVEAVRHSAEDKKLIVKTDFDSDDCSVTGDAFRLQQVIMNLLTNAVKFTPEGGTIEISLKTVGAKARITVKDTGIGIDSELLPYIFERFKQADSSTKRKFGGLGLGLAIAKSLVELQGGEIFAESEGENKGARFTVELPLVQTSQSWKKTEPESKLSPERAGGENQLAGVKIVLVDDDADSLEFLRIFLTDKGANVDGFADALTALESIKKTAPDILISDISMAEMDGYDLIKKVRALPSAKDKFIPAIALTAYASLEDRAALLSAGFQMHLPKPVDIDSISESILEILDKFH